VTDWILVPEDIDLIGIAPHAHLLCRDMKADAKLPDGTTVPLIWIKDWDFNWQGQYRYAEPVHLPRGTHIGMRYIYDNSSGNPHNPSSPPSNPDCGGCDGWRANSGRIGRRTGHEAECRRPETLQL
jgi:hypothetical protein